MDLDQLHKQSSLLLLGPSETQNASGSSSGSGNGSGNLIISPPTEGPLFIRGLSMDEPDGKTPDIPCKLFNFFIFQKL
jgi:hypothetical protein